ncbi:hypothetical protein AK812_SmicGene27950 [Symbiodinium microadriaticum]|uniref:Protein N-lysine methyltransferase METTL21A n=1 Tax=Symbiodinium microadriaticum TaxID=2951 RepID=A0A1Q9D5V5_SYMMI|nr:hypothetical protein AK812_SmicGene27950 [Symbiodinium microadriaticum]
MPPKAGDVAADRFCTAEGIVIFEGKPHKEKVLYGNLLWDGALALCRFFASEWSPAVAGKSALELGAGTGVVGLTLGHLGAEEKKATEDPYLEMDAAKEMPVESHEERVGYSMADVSEQIRCSFWLLSLLHFVQEGHQHRQPTVTNQGLGFVARRLLSGIQASYDRFRGKRAVECTDGLDHPPAAPVCITDSEKELLPLMEQNIQANSLGSCTIARRLDWGDETSYMHEKPDLLVAADVLYEGGAYSCFGLFAAQKSSCRDQELGDACGFGPNPSQMQSQVPEAYVANHHNPKNCEATLGFLRAVLQKGMEVQRLEDAEGFALGCLQSRSGFRDARFVSLGRDVEAALRSVRDARFRERDLSPMKHIQIFRLTWSVLDAFVDKIARVSGHRAGKAELSLLLRELTAQETKTLQR